jgi:hypothetical protein
MRKTALFLALIILTIPLFALDIFHVDPEAEAYFSSLLNKPTMVSPAVASPLGRNWFRLETDAHVITDAVTVSQVSEMLLDIPNYNRFFNGRRSKLMANPVGNDGDEQIIDFISVVIIPIVNVRFYTPYRGLTKIVNQTDTVFSLEVSQTPMDSESNRKVRNLVARRHIEEVTIDGNKYTYIRIYSITDMDASILPNAKILLERNSVPANEEALNLMIRAARTK